MKTKIKENLNLTIENYSVENRPFDCNFYSVHSLIKTINLDVSELSIEQFNKLTDKGFIETIIKRNMTLNEIIKHNDLNETEIIKILKKHYER